MLHKGKLQAALNAKRGQFSLFDDSFSEQLQMYQHALEKLYEHFPSSHQLEHALPPNESGMPSAGARPSDEFDRWLVHAAHAAHDEYHGPLFPFGREFTSHEHARQWAECIEGVTTIAVDGSQLLPWRDASVPVALVQVGFFVNPHAQGRPYTKDVRMEVLAPEEIMEESKSETSDPDSYPYSEMQVTLRRYLLEVETICDLMQQWATARCADDPVYSPVVFFDGSLVVSFALTMPNPYRERYINSALSLLRTSEELRVPLIGYIDTSYARDMITMLRRLDATLKRPVLRDTKKIHDALLWQGHLHWGDRTPAMICARQDILQSYGPYRDSVAFCYLQTSANRAPTRLEFPRWMLEDGVLEPVLDIVRAEIIAGNGYPYAIETADAVSVITMQDRSEFYNYFQAFMQKQGVKFSYSTKSLSKNRRR
ncbi:MAG: DNA double-strand break repair nuclease NurA [Ktedonobacteraceae bacterium]